MGSASTESSDARTARLQLARERSSLVASVMSRSGTWSPNTVRVWAPLAVSSGERMLGSVSEWQ